MKKLLIVGFYELKEHLLFIANQFEKYGYEIDSYPLFRFGFDPNDKVDDIQEHFNNYVTKSDPDILLLWFFDVNPKIIRYVKSENPHVKFIMFNGDDPMNFNTALMEKCKTCDTVVTSCNDGLSKYKRFAGVKNVMFQPHGYDPNYFYKLKSDDITDEDRQNFGCDISFIVFNMYDDPYYSHQDIPRKKLVDDLIRYCKENDKTFKIFGPTAIKTYCPDNYAGEIGYLDQNKLFNLSKINLVTHPFCNKDSPITDLEMKILGSGGLLVTDRFKNIDEIFKDGDSVCVLDKDGYIEQIDDILGDGDNKKRKRQKNINISKIKENGAKLAERYSWGEWVLQLHIVLNKAEFDPSFYRELYGIESDVHDDKLWDDWLESGLTQNRLTSKFRVPTSFQHEGYAEFNSLDVINKHMLYLHWKTHGKDKMWMIKGNKGTGLHMDASLVDTSVEEVFEINTMLTEIKKSKDKTDALERLSNRCKNSPYIKINKILQMYLELVDA